MRTISLCICSLVALSIGCTDGSSDEENSSRSDRAQSDDDYQVAVYYFPNYHADPRQDQMFGAGWTEWQLVWGAGPRYYGHRQPRIPAWPAPYGNGSIEYEDEANPGVMARKIDAAADHGVTQFIFDWYWYDGAPFLYRALEEGFLGAPNRDRLEFALMWANHDWVHLFPKAINENYQTIYPGTVTMEEFERVTDYIVYTYFVQPNYWKIDGKPYFSVYTLENLINGLGSADAARIALARFREKTQAAGFPGLHLNVVIYGGYPIAPADVAAIGFDSVTNYSWSGNIAMDQFPVTAYGPMVDTANDLWTGQSGSFPTEYFPNVTVGWDSSPRAKQSDEYRYDHYPFWPVIEGNYPSEFRRALENVKGFLDARGGNRVVTVNSWNEWTEGSYLEPDTTYGMGYLEAIRDVFGDD